MMRFLSLLLAILIVLPACAIDRAKVDKALGALDRSLEKRMDFISARQSYIDSLSSLYHADTTRHDLLMTLGDAYKGFNNDSALAYLSKGAALDDDSRLPFRWKLAALLPLSGLFDRATSIYDSIDVAAVPDSLLVSYYDSGRQMHSYIAAFFKNYPEAAAPHGAASRELQEKMLGMLAHDSQEYRFNDGEYRFFTGQSELAKLIFQDVLADDNSDLRLIAMAAHHLSSLARNEGDEDAYNYYLAVSANADVMTATREVASLQELGASLYDAGDIARSHRYLSSALENAVECGAPLRMIETSRSLPIIERAHISNIDSQRRTINYIVLSLLLLLMVLAVTMFVLRREMKRMTALQDNLRAANAAKEVYISQFLQLCSIYMDKLNQFCKIATRKLAAGQADELYRMTKSGKFAEEQSHEFYEVFDNAFLHIYPDFVAQVNALLRPEARIELPPGEMLNTDLRILAFMRLGIEESARIAQILNYSLNTIYAYRNRLKTRAIDRENFEADIMKIDFN
ncbi:MAG: hypothetical protein J6C95_06755 [Muribaculaceae bacterium]|nr:hypothetical protein [Muribaculaceae bacterium]